MKNLNQASSLLNLEGKKINIAALHPKQTRCQAALHADKGQVNKPKRLIQALIQKIKEALWSPK